MRTIRYTTSLLYYDGPQIIEARDAEGRDFLAVLVETGNGQDRYLAVEIVPDRLCRFREGALDLRSVVAESAERGWYLTATADLNQPLTIERQQTPIEDSGFLPDDEFVLQTTESAVEPRQTPSGASTRTQ